MKKTVSFLVASFLISSVHAAEKIVVASAASTQPKAVVAKAKKADAAQTRSFSKYELESFNASGLPQ